MSLCVQSVDNGIDRLDLSPNYSAKIISMYSCVNICRLPDDQPRMLKSHNLVSYRLSMRTVVVMLPCVFVDNCSPCSLHYFLLRHGAPVTQPGPSSCLRLDTFAILGFQFGLVVALSFLHTNQPCFIAVLFLYYASFFTERTKRYEIYVVTYQALEKRPGKQIQNQTGLSSNK